MKIFLLFVILSFSCGVSCNQNSVDTDYRTLGNFVLEAEYVNYAWGYTAKGVFMGEDGKRITYDAGLANYKVRINPDNYYAEAELYDKYDHYDTLRAVIPVDTLVWCFQKALLVDETTYSDTLSTGADMGALTYSVYRYESKRKAYRKIILYEEGDRTFYNTSTAAAELTNWFKRR